MKTFFYMRKAVIMQLNRFIIDTTRMTDGRPSAQMVFNADFRPSMNGYFNEDGFCCMAGSHGNKTNG